LTPIGADGTVDISPSARLFIKESAIVQALYDGLELLLDAEKAAAPAEAEARALLSPSPLSPNPRP